MRFTSTSLDETLLSEKFCWKHNTRIRWNINTGSKWFTGNWNGQLELLTVLIINKWSHSIKDILHSLIISLIRIRNHSLFSMGGGGEEGRKRFSGAVRCFPGGTGGDQLSLKEELLRISPSPKGGGNDQLNLIVSHLNSFLPTQAIN